jgi:hypothetical protein
MHCAEWWWWYLVVPIVLSFAHNYMFGPYVVYWGYFDPEEIKFCKKFLIREI